MRFTGRNDTEDGQLAARAVAERATRSRLDLGAVEADLDLTGLRLSRLRVESGASDGKLRFDSLNAVRMSALEISLGAASFRADRLANANAQRHPRQSGSWQRRARSERTVDAGHRSPRRGHARGRHDPRSLGRRRSRHGQEDARVVRARRTDRARRRMGLAKLGVGPAQGARHGRNSLRQAHDRQDRPVAADRRSHTICHLLRATHLEWRMVVLGYRVGPLGEENAQGDSRRQSARALGPDSVLLLLLAVSASAVRRAAAEPRREQAARRLICSPSQLQQVVPSDGWALIGGVIKDVVYAKNAPGLMSVGALLAIWAGSNVFGALIDALNAAYDVEDTRPWWKKKLIAVASVIVHRHGDSRLDRADPRRGQARRLDRRIGSRSSRARARSRDPGCRCRSRSRCSSRSPRCLTTSCRTCARARRQVLVGAVFTTIAWTVVTLAFRVYVDELRELQRDVRRHRRRDRPAHVDVLLDARVPHRRRDQLRAAPGHRRRRRRDPGCCTAGASRPRLPRACRRSTASSVSSR